MNPLTSFEPQPSMGRHITPDAEGRTGLKAQNEQSKPEGSNDFAAILGRTDTDLSNLLQLSGPFSPEEPDTDSELALLASTDGHQFADGARASELGLGAEKPAANEPALSQLAKQAAHHTQVVRSEPGLQPKFRNTGSGADGPASSQPAATVQRGDGATFFASQEVLSRSTPDASPSLPPTVSGPTGIPRQPDTRAVPIFLTGTREEIASSQTGPNHRLEFAAFSKINISSPLVICIFPLNPSF